MQFTLGEFSTRLSLHEEAADVMTDLHNPMLLICDENTLKLIQSHSLLPAGTQLPEVRSEEDLSGLVETPASAHYAPQAAVVLPPGESGKTLPNVELILKTAFSLGFARDSSFVALGGGAVTDAAAFASSLFMRGNTLILIPTTLLAMVDAAFGGKTGINYYGYKNMVGSFYPAGQLRVYPGFLKNLPQREYLSGLAEVIKSAMLDDAELFTYLEKQRSSILNRDPQALEHIIWKSLMVKGRVVLADLREGGIRAQLNLGHTFAHALEAVSGLGLWSHGEAVAWGLLRALELGRVLEVTPDSYISRVETLLRTYGYRLDSSGCPSDKLIHAMKNDKKKKGGQVGFILQKDLCETFQRPVEDAAILQVLN